MKIILLKLFESLLKKKIDEKAFLERFQSETGIFLDEELCLKKINEGIVECDDGTIDLFMQAGFMVTFTQKSLPTMCELLKSHCHHKHEDIAMLLKELADYKTVDYLYEATELEFGYLSYDDTYQFARKCIKALSTIGNDNAINKLKLLANSRVTEIAGYAQKELRYKGIL